MASSNLVSRYVERFNADDNELYGNLIPNSQASEFLSKHIPIFECPDSEIESVYYFRWWTFRKHLRATDDGGFVVTEFLPKVVWSGLYNAISCPASHHFAEGRWLRDSKYLKSYAHYWFNCGKNIRRYTFPVAHSILELHKVYPDAELLAELYPKMKENMVEWEKENFDAKRGMFWQIDSKDGMEVSISGALCPKGRISGVGYRATINAHMYGEYWALSKIAKILGKADDAKFYSQKADETKSAINEKLWDESARFYKVIPLNSEKFSDARELHGYTPYLYLIPPRERLDAWKQLSDAGGFKAPFGPTSAEQRHPKFAVSYEGHECQWNGPSWPFSTSVTLSALANCVNAYANDTIANKHLYFETLQTYAMSHHRILESGKRVMWIDENLNPYNGDWISRTRLSNWEGKGWSPKKGGKERGKDYNHSQFCNHIISELIGVRPNLDSSVTINPLVPDSWAWFKLENVKIKGAELSVYYDEDGKKFGKEKGLSVYVNGKLVAKSKKISPLKIEIK